MDKIAEVAGYLWTNGWAERNGGNITVNITDLVDRAKADYRATHKVGVQSCKVYIKPEEGAAYYVINKVSGKLEL